MGHDLEVRPQVHQQGELEVGEEQLGPTRNNTLSAPTMRCGTPHEDTSNITQCLLISPYVILLTKGPT